MVRPDEKQPGVSGFCSGNSSTEESTVSVSFFKKTFESLPAPVAVRKLSDGQIAFSNTRYKDFLSHFSEESDGSVPLNADAFNQAGKEKGETSCPISISDNSGSRLNWLVQYSVVDPVPDSEDVFIVELLQKADEGTHCTSRDFYRNTVESANEGVWHLDTNGSTTFVNHRMACMLGYSPEEMLGKPFTVFMDDQWRGMASRLFEQRRQGHSEQHDFMFIRKDGRPFWSIVNATSILDAEGKFQGALALVTDINQRKASEDALKQYNRQIVDILESISDGFFSLDEKLVVRFMNREAERILKCSSREVLGKNLFDAFPEARDSVFETNYRRALREKVPLHFEIYFSPHEQWYEVRVFPCDQGISVYFQLTTERRKFEQALRESEEKYRLLAETAGDIIMMVDSGGRIRYINTTGLQKGGYTSSQVISIPFQDLIHTPHFSGAASKKAESLPSRKGVFVYEGYFRGHQGDFIPVEICSSPVVQDGKLTGTLVIARDIVGRKTAETALRRLATAVDQAAEAIVVTDIQGNIEYVNPAFEQVTGYSCREVLGENPRILKSGQQDEAFYQQLWDAITEGEVWRNRMVNRRKDGTLYQEDATISPVRDADGRIVNFVAVKRDVTQEARLENQLRQAQKMEAIGQIAGGVAHDFNNLLQAIKGHLQFAMEGLSADDSRYRELLEILRASNNAASLTRKLLTFSRQGTRQPRVFDLNESIQDIGKILRRVIGENYELDFVPASNLKSIKADLGQMEQILMNLCVNARDAMPGGGRITVSTENRKLARRPVFLTPNDSFMRGDYVVLKVTDEGAGMKKEVLDHIFEPFFTTKKEGQGTGLGLATVYGIVRQHGGFIDVASEPGRGTTFSLYFHATDAPPERNIAKRSAAVTGGEETILLAEDDPCVCNLACRVLRKAGYEVLSAANGQQAIEIFDKQSSRISIAILDMVMPRVSGGEVFEHICKTRPDLPVIFSSGYSDSVIDISILRESQADLLRKPYDPAVLLQRIREILDSRKEKSASSS